MTYASSMKAICASCANSTSISEGFVMQFPESWLRAFVNPSLDTEALAHSLTMAGLEVEETNPYAPAFSGIVVAKVMEVQPHPDADKLRVCAVDDGSGQPLQIVCGAPNVEPGIKVP